MNAVSSTHAHSPGATRKSKTINEKERRQRGSWQVRFVAVQTNGSRTAAGADDDLAFGGVFHGYRLTHGLVLDGRRFEARPEVDVRALASPSPEQQVKQDEPSCSWRRGRNQRQKGERQAADQATSWVQAASQSWLRRRDLRMEHQNWRNDCQSGLRRDGGVQVIGCFERIGLLG